MSSKKKQTKKHKFKYATPTTTAAASSTEPTLAVTPKASKAVAAAVDASVYSYVQTDLRKVGLVAGGLIVVEFVLWLLFGHTGLGNAVYSLIKV